MILHNLLALIVLFMCSKNYTTYWKLHKYIRIISWLMARVDIISCKNTFGVKKGAAK